MTALASLVGLSLAITLGISFGLATPFFLAGAAFVVLVVLFVVLAGSW